MRPGSRRIGLGLLGCGGYGLALARALREVPGARLVAACDPVAERARAAGAPRVAASLDELLGLPEVEALVLATPNSLHRPQALAAARAGRHVFVEKPLATTAAAALEVVAGCLEAGVALVAGHNAEWLEAAQALPRDLGDRGIPVRRVEARMARRLGAPAVEGGWRLDPRECPGGAMMQLGIHAVGLLLSWLGPPRAVRGEVGERGPEGLVLQARLEWSTAAGVPVAVAADWLAPGPLLEVAVETPAGSFLLAPDRLSGPGLDLAWEAEAAWHRSRVVLLGRFLAAAAAGEPGNGAHAAAAVALIEEGLGPWAP